MFSINIESKYICFRTTRVKISNDSVTLRSSMIISLHEVKLWSDILQKLKTGSDAVGHYKVLLQGLTMWDTLAISNPVFTSVSLRNIKANVRYYMTASLFSFDPRNKKNLSHTILKYFSHSIPCFPTSSYCTLYKSFHSSLIGLHTQW